MLKIGHTVTIPPSLRGPDPKPEDDVIPIPEELEVVPGIPTDDDTVNYYSMQYPIESHNVENFMYRGWSRSISDIKETRDEHERLFRPILRQTRVSGDVEPTAEPADRDVTDDIKQKALELGFAMVGMTNYDNRYTYRSKREWIKPFPHALCLAMEQPYEETQDIPSEPAEAAVFATYRRMNGVSLELADYIRSLGYHAQIHSTGDAAGAVHPMFVNAGMGQMGAMGYLLSPHFGSRHRLMLITTDAPVTYDQPVDYGIHAFCTICQVCVNRCPGRALMREQVWWRGVHKFKIIAKRCRPVMARYAACGVCMKVCPIQRYGLKAVMEHYAETGQVLGKGTHNLEGYDMHDIGYFGPGELPRFDRDFFHIPEGYADQFALDSLKERLQAGDTGDDVWREFRAQMEEVISGPQDAMAAEWEKEDQDEF